MDPVNSVQTEWSVWSTACTKEPKSGTNIQPEGTRPHPSREEEWMNKDWLPQLVCTVLWNTGRHGEKFNGISGRLAEKCISK